MSVSKQNYFYSIGCTLLRNKQSRGGIVLLKPFLIIIIIIITCLLAQLHIIYQQQQRGRYLRSLLLLFLTQSFLTTSYPQLALQHYPIQYLVSTYKL